MELSLIAPFMMNHFVEHEKIWIEAHGLPAHAWNEANIRKVGEVWGRVIRIEEQDDCHIDSFMVLVESNYGPYVQSWMDVMVDGREYRMFVKEQPYYTKSLETMCNQSEMKVNNKVTLEVMEEREPETVAETPPELYQRQDNGKNNEENETSKVRKEGEVKTIGILMLQTTYQGVGADRENVVT
ncbi:hypothetical protein PIB30_099849 [Stylosanthes scabra]|uniref:DUF4283 domain-containing protein n=1 Tax=Stylosanthes scabra TaxID=79078 RepID=A0ABU6VYW2_9FABA|nr:hypothetical protein [Stylosanthes scabra]